MEISPVDEATLSETLEDLEGLAMASLGAVLVEKLLSLNLSFLSPWVGVLSL